MSWVSLGASWEGLRASWEGPKASWEGPKASWEALRASWEAPGGGRTDGRKTKTEKISLCGDAIGHRPLRGRCPLTTKLTEKLTSKILIRGHREPLTM